MVRLSSSISALALALAALVYGSPARANPSPIPVRSLAAIGCPASYEELAEDPKWFEHLVDPVLASQAEIDAKLDLYSRIDNCLSGPPGALSSEEQNIKQLVEYFLVFAGGLDAASPLTTVSLATSTDPAVRALRDSVGIPVPPGFVYVRTYPSREAMPALIRSKFESPLVAGVTLNTRYIAVLADTGGAASPFVSRTISHELVHAYVNSAAGPTAFLEFPKWYAEGLAIHFSGSEEPACAEQLTADRNYTLHCEMVVDEYAQYRDNIKFLQDALGNTMFQAAVGASVAQHDASLIYRDLGIASYDDLVKRTAAWHEQRNKNDALRFLWGGIALIVFFGILVLLINWLRSGPVLWRRAPAAELPPPVPAHVQVARVVRSPSAPMPSPSVGVRRAVPAITPVTSLSAEVAARLKATAPAASTAAVVKPAALAAPKPAASPAVLPRPLSAEETARATAFWDGLANFPQLLGSTHRVEYVLKMRAQGGSSEWHHDYLCPNCSRQAVVQLPNDVSYEQYAEVIRNWAKDNGRQPPAPAVIMRPYAICLCCGRLFWSDSFGIPQAPLPVRPM